MDAPTRLRQTQPTEFLPVQVARWHPKMSSYRISVIVMTVVLGTLKAVFVYRGVSIVSTTLEWIAGVVFTLLFFTLDEWESKEIYPKNLHWFFNFDCAELIWRILAIFSISRPRYRSEESRASLRDSPVIPMTGYRILVSTTVITLGSTKAVLAFLDQNTSTNYLDWILGALITSVLYCIGLYESNSVNLAPNFFVHDHQTVVSRICRDTVAVFVLGACLIASIKWLELSLSIFGSDFSEFVASVNDRTESDPLVLLMIGGFFRICLLGAGTVLPSLGAVVVTLIFIILALREEAELSHLLFRRGKVAKYYDNLSTTLATSLRQASRVAPSILRASIHLVGIVILTSAFLTCLIFVWIMLGKGFDLYRGLGPGEVVGMIAMLLLFGYYTIFLTCLVYYIICSLFYLPASLPSVFG